MHKVLGSLAAAMMFACAGSAGAASVTVFGQLVSEGTRPYVDPNLAVGDQVKAEITFDAADAMKLGDSGYFVAQMTSLKVSSDGFLMPFSDINDGRPFASVFYETSCEAEQGPGCSHTDRWQLISAPAILFQGAKVLGLIGTSAPHQGNYGPDYHLGSSYTGFGLASCYCIRQSVADPYICDGDGTDRFFVSSGFAIVGPEYGTYQTQGFKGLWDFDSTFISVPEPSTWAMMIVGFGLAGATLRRRRLVHAPA